MAEFNATQKPQAVRGVGPWYRSLRWRIQAWYALLLLSALVGFGALLHHETTRAFWNDVDDELISAARNIDATLRRTPMTMGDGPNFDPGAPFPPRNPPRDPQIRDPQSRDPSRRPPRPDGTRFEGPRPEGPSRPDGSFRPENAQPRMDGMPRPPGPFDPQDGPGRRPPPQVRLDSPEWNDARIELPPRLTRGDQKAYFIIWRSDGGLFRKQDAPEDEPKMEQASEYELNRHRMYRQHRAGNREVFMRGPQQSMICVGRPVINESRRITNFGIFIGLVGFGIFSIAMLGGWWSMNRTLAPLHKMTATAEAITAQSLDRRLELQGIDNELSGLGQVLNGMLDRLESGFEQQRKFSADASHELRTPLAVMINSTELALSRDRSADAYRSELERCHRAALRMNELVEALLTLSRLEANGIEPSFASVELSSVCEEQMEHLRSLMEQNNIRVELHGPNGSILGNENLIGLLVSNLLTNAIKYNRPNGKVTVTIAENGEQVSMTIEDTGVGIPAADLPYIFDRFFRVDKARSRLTGGSGLGLAICKQIVDRHHGTIEITSQEGVGTKATVTFPRQSAAVDRLGKRQGK